MKKKLYLAYGSNLNKAAMRRRCPDARPRGTFLLGNAKLVFRGVADVEYDPNPETVVPIGLWEISLRDEAALDCYEGVNSKMYFKNQDIRLKYQGKRRRALIYLMNSDGIYPPSQGYVDTIVQGYRDFGLDMAYLEEAIERSFLEKSPDEQTVSRRRRERLTHERRKLVAMPEAVALQRLKERDEKQKWYEESEAAFETSSPEGEATGALEE